MTEPSEHKTSPREAAEQRAEDWRRANVVTDWEAGEVGRLLCDYSPRDLALMVVRRQGEIEDLKELAR